jgi:oligopeptide/dipeptide ABC transporter ATP-binding protein
MSAAPLLQVTNLSKTYPVTRRRLFRQKRGVVHAVDDVSFQIGRQETLSLVGESGCGKTTTARSILYLTPPSGGAIYMNGSDIGPALLGGDRAAKLRVRRKLQYVFQDPMLALNPRWTAADTLREPLRVHMPERHGEFPARIEALLRQVGLEPRHANRYPHEVSGGQRQRIGIARALAVEPDLLICDEPVSSLDVSVRAQILNLLAALQDQLGLSYLYISHDLSSVRFISTHVAVMYLGRIVELGRVGAVFDAPRHHYTQALLSAIPVPDPDAAQTRILLQGEVPSALRRPSGCAFHPRCRAALPMCQQVVPELTTDADGHAAACHNPV